MGLGMLLPSSADNQRALADNTTAMQALLAKDHKEQVEAALRAALPS
eukprot:gene13360-19205_t